MSARRITIIVIVSFKWTQVAIIPKHTGRTLVPIYIVLPHIGVPPISLYNMRGKCKCYVNTRR